MRETNFGTEILTDEVVVCHRGDGHIFRFPILLNGTVSLDGCRIELNPNAKQDARYYVFDAHKAARAAIGHDETDL
jgi:hypothetical protein